MPLSILVGLGYTMGDDRRGSEVRPAALCPLTPGGWLETHRLSKTDSRVRHYSPSHAPNGVAQAPQEAAAAAARLDGAGGVLAPRRR